MTLNKEKLRIKDMCDADVLAIVRAVKEGRAERYDLACFPARWQLCGILHINLEEVYRVKPKQLQIPWEHINKNINFIAMFQDGTIVGSSHKLERSIPHWFNCTGTFFRLDSILTIGTTDIDWEVSQVERPKQ